MNINGVFREYLPGDVPTMALWAEGDQTREITGAENARYPAQSHTEIATSPQGFKEAYRFFFGKKPKTTKVIPERPNKVTVKGRALNFPANTGLAGGQLSVYQLNPKTGQRLKKRLVYSKTITANGNFGPVRVNGFGRYEFEVKRDDQQTIHNYPESFERDDHFFRVLAAGALTPFLAASPNHSNVAVTRMREWRSDQTGSGANDRLILNGDNVLATPIAPRVKRILAVFNFDVGTDGESDHSAIALSLHRDSLVPDWNRYLPAGQRRSQRQDQVVEKMRSPRAHTKVVNLPNWLSADHSLSVYSRTIRPSSTSSAR